MQNGEAARQSRPKSPTERMNDNLSYNLRDSKIKSRGKGQRGSDGLPPKNPKLGAFGQMMSGIMGGNSDQAQPLVN